MNEPDFEKLFEMRQPNVDDDGNIIVGNPSVFHLSQAKIEKEAKEKSLQNPKTFKNGNPSRPPL
jgi:hypothetical protein